MKTAQIITPCRIRIQGDGWRATHSFNVNELVQVIRVNKKTITIEGGKSSKFVGKIPLEFVAWARLPKRI